MESFGGKSSKIQQMIKFIESEADEKIEEIALKIEEEVATDVNRVKKEQYAKITEFYKKKQKQLEIKKKIIISQVQNSERIKVLKAREDKVKDVVDETLERLAVLVEDACEYRKLLEGLISQGLFQLLSDNVVLKCRKKDLDLVQEVIPLVTENYEANSGKKVEISINKKSYLSDGIVGGVELYTQGGKVKVVNTMERRLALISEKEMPEIRYSLFGQNSNRKFKD